MRNQYAHLGLEHAGDPWTPLLNWKLIGAILHSDTWAEVKRRCGRTQNALLSQTVRLMNKHYPNWQRTLNPEADRYDWFCAVAREVKARKWAKNMFFETWMPFYNMELEMSDKPEGFYMVKGPGPTRVKQQTEAVAMCEAHRLAKANPGEPFYVMRAIKVVVFNPEPKPTVRDL